MESSGSESSEVESSEADAPDREELRGQVEEHWSAGDSVDREEARHTVARLMEALERGRIRAARPVEDGWEAVEWVKRGILLAFRVGRTRRFEGYGTFFDRDTLPLRNTRGVEENIRIVPGGSSVRSGAYLAPGVVIMPPAYVNIGAYVDEGAMIDSHALVGSCAQIGKRVHLSAGAQIGGVLEPVGLRPVVVEDDAMIGANTGVFEGVRVGRRAVLAPGVNLTASTTLFDIPNETEIRKEGDQPLEVPAGAVVVPGGRPARGAWAQTLDLQLYAPVIVKYRDESTDAATALEDVLR
ncbi:MAG: 2,3,4,5-tetrahydropyridine-2,6-dicarboxylate N-succinyltransferase [Longimicrobiales bacterium]|nr:2,3,4,5-tetrahydropyridine-2,6-dicarboxylate N-succinyltransferase [Longimicrobiales bacterium]